jgi:hypothetical protein
MSRTFKDRPYWVKVNDPKKFTLEAYHDHVELGKPIYRHFPVLDENGEPVTKEVIVEYSFFPGARRKFIERQYDRRLIGYNVSECEVNRPETREDYRHCGHVLEYYNYDSPQRYGKKIKHTASRARERQTLNRVPRNFSEDGYEGEDLRSWESFTKYEIKRVG